MSATNSNGKLSLDGPGAAYLRVSDDQQDTQRQYEALHAFEKRHSVTIPKQNWFKDEGWARDTADHRPDFQRLMKLVEAGAVRWIVVDQLDRFGVKNAKQLFAYLFRLEEAGCKLYDANGKEWTGEDDSTEITAWIGGKQSAKEQKDKSYRALSGKVARARVGEWQGGPVRLELDVVCYHRETDDEQWRVVMEALHKRQKVYPDGRTERFDGPNNFPRYQPATEVLRIAPSNDKTKLDAAESVFKRFATESISPTTLAHYLNGLSFRTAFGGLFQGHHVSAMLEDPAYIGYYAYNRKHYGKFHRWADGQPVHELNYEEKQSRNDKADWVQSRRLFDPLVDRPTWDAGQKKLEKPRRETAPRSAALYLAGLVVCGNCGAKMIAGRGRSSKTDSQPLRFEFICGGYHKAVRNKERLDTTCLRNSVFQNTLEEYIRQYLEETGKRLVLLTTAPDGSHLTDRLEGQEDESWRVFCDGLDQVVTYLSQHHTDEYNALLQEENARREERDAMLREDAGYQPPVPGTLARVVQKVFELEQGGERPDQPRLPANDFVRDLVASYRGVFDPSALAVEVERLETEHTAMMHRYADLPTPRAKQKAEAELAQLEARIEELEGQQQNVADVVERQWQEIRDLSRAIRDAQLAIRNDTEERALRHRAEALRGIIHRIECTFTITGATGGGHGRKNTQLAKVTIYPIVGDAAHFRIEADNVLRATRATSPM
jgi:DNA invertase Pin-like site-specific DNA recombinase